VKVKCLTAVFTISLLCTGLLSTDVDIRIRMNVSRASNVIMLDIRRKKACLRGTSLLSWRGLAVFALFLSAILDTKKPQTYADIFKVCYDGTTKTCNVRYGSFFTPVRLVSQYWAALSFASSTVRRHLTRKHNGTTKP